MSSIDLNAVFILLTTGAYSVLPVSLTYDFYTKTQPTACQNQQMNEIAN